MSVGAKLRNFIVGCEGYFKESIDECEGGREDYIVEELSGSGDLWPFKTRLVFAGLYLLILASRRLLVLLVLLVPPISLPVHSLGQWGEKSTTLLANCHLAQL